MEDLELKEKLLCVLRNNAGNIQGGYSPWLKTNQGFIYLGKDIKTKIIKTSIFVFFKRNLLIDEGYSYSISFVDSSFPITEKEYEEILSLREEKIREEQIEELDRLCNIGN